MNRSSEDYLCFKIADLADEMGKDNLSYRRSFSTHLLSVAKALHAIEYVQSGQNPEGSERSAIQECINPSYSLRSLVMEAEKIRDELKLLLKRAK